MITLPPWLDSEAWQGFCEMRRAMPKSRPFTERAQHLILKRLGEIRAAGWDPNAALDQSTERGWSGVWPAQNREIAPVARTSAAETQAFLAEQAAITPNAEIARMARQAVRLVK